MAPWPCAAVGLQPTSLTEMELIMPMASKDKPSVLSASSAVLHYLLVKPLRSTFPRTSDYRGLFYLREDGGHEHASA